MNFSKYIAALALFATAAYAAESGKNDKDNAPAPEVEKKTETKTETKPEETKVVLIEMSAADLITAYKACKANDTTKVNQESMVKCLTEEPHKVDKRVAEKAFAALDKLEEAKLDDAAAKAVIDGVNEDIKKGPAASGNWYDSINNVYGYTGGAILAFVLIGGGVYMAVGRKSEDADL